MFEKQLKSPLRSPLLRAILAGSGVYVPPAPALTYGAPPDAGEVNNTDIVTGSRYYFDYVSGSDSNNPPSLASPGKTLDYVYDWMTTDSTAGGRLAPRDSAILLKRGTTYNGFMAYNNFDSSFFGNYLVGAYGGSGARPKIYFQQNSSQSNMSLALAALKRTGGRLKNVDVDGQMLVAFNNTPTGTFTFGETVTGGTSGATGVYQYLASTTNLIQLTSFPTQFAAGETVTGASSGATVVVGTRAYPAAVVLEGTACTIENVGVANLTGEAVAIGSGGTPPGGGDPRGDNTTISGVSIDSACLIQDAGAGLAGGNGTNISITYTTIKDCGNSDRSHNIYFNSVVNLRIANCWSYMTQNHGNHGLVLHDVCTDVVIEDNLFEGCGNGIGINDGHSSIEAFTNVVVRRNINRNHGTWVGQTQGQPFDLSCLVNSEFYNNLSYGCNSTYNIVAWRGTAGGDSVTTNTRFSHETVHNCKGGIRVTGTMGAIPPIVQNSIISSSRTTNDEVILYVDAAAIASGVVFRNNILWAPNATGNVIYWNTTYYSIAAWMTAFGNALGCINADPLFVNAAAGDFRLQAGSPAKLAGYNSGIADDFALTARHATTPSIGAYE